MNATARPLIERLHQARAVTDALFERIRPDMLYERPIAQRHRLVFYLGHLEAFDWNLLTGRRSPRANLHPTYDELFAFGIDPLGSDLPRDVPSDWPSIDQMLGYRELARTRIDQLVDELPLTQGSPWPLDDAMRDGGCLVHAAIEHRLMHAETLAYLFHRLPLGAFDAGGPEADDAVSRTPLRPPGPEAGMVTVPAGRVRLGCERDPAGAFGWDNEFTAHEVDVPAFEIDRTMVTNGQYQRFLEARGYQHPEFWHPPDWDWVQTHRIAHPAFWRLEGDTWLLRTMSSERPLPMDWPVYVSHAEACAYARWCGKALPSEAQWMRAASGVPLSNQSPVAGNFDARRWDPQSVNLPSNISAHGVEGLFGNGWEWTRTPFAPYPGFEAFPFYPGYSKNFFDGRHHVLKGGSPRTAACMMRPSFRNWFQPHYQYVYAGFRCVTEDPSCSHNP